MAWRPAVQRLLAAEAAGARQVPQAGRCRSGHTSRLSSVIALTGRAVPM